MACLQSGSGIPVYSGTIMQRGYGVGGLFRRLASGLLTLLPRIGKTVMSIALGVANDKMRGVPLSEALKKLVKNCCLTGNLQKEKKREDMGYVRQNLFSI